MFIAYETMVKNRFQTDHQEVLQHCTEFLTGNVSLSNTKSTSADHHEKVRKWLILCLQVFPTRHQD